MVDILVPVVATGPTYVKVANVRCGDEGACVVDLAVLAARRWQYADGLAGGRRLLADR